MLLDYNGEHWPDEVKKSFIDYVKGGGSALLIHAANNSFSGWTEYEEMVGLLSRGSDFGVFALCRRAGPDRSRGTGQRARAWGTGVNTPGS